MKKFFVALLAAVFSFVVATEVFAENNSKSDIAFFMENFCGNYVDVAGKLSDLKIEYVGDSQFCMSSDMESYYAFHSYTIPIKRMLNRSNDNDCFFSLKVARGFFGSAHLSFHCYYDTLFVDDQAIDRVAYNNDEGDFGPRNTQTYLKCEASRYGGKNGRIISFDTQNTNPQYQYTLREHNQIIDNAGNKYLISPYLYSEPSQDGKKLAKVKGSLQVKQFLTMQSKVEPKKVQIWLCVENNGNNGWICAFEIDDDSLQMSYLLHPYLNSKWAYLGSINSGGKTWTTRKMIQTITIQENLNVRSAPGTDSRKVTSLKKNNSKEDDTYIVVAATEEKDVIDGISDRWLKIMLNDGREGWIFGGYVTTDCEDLGFKYHAADDIVEFYFR